MADNTSLYLLESASFHYRMMGRPVFRYGPEVLAGICENERLLYIQSNDVSSDLSMENEREWGSWPYFFKQRTRIREFYCLTSFAEAAESSVIPPPPYRTNARLPYPWPLQKAPRNYNLIAQNESRPHCWPDACFTSVWANTEYPYWPYFIVNLYQLLYLMYYHVMF